MAIVLASTEGMPYADWLEYRRLGIGGSDASVVCGINKYKSTVELWAEKTGQLPRQEAGEAAYWGTRLESLVCEEFTARTGIAVTPVKQILQSEEHPFMLANLDGECIHPIYGKCVFEAKTSSAYLADGWEDSIPDVYMLQIQHYLCVTGYPGAYIAVLIGGNTFKWKFIERDEEIIAMLIQLESVFWQHVQEGTPPSLDGSEASAAFINKRFPNSIPLSKINLPNTAEALINQYDSTCELLAKINEQKAEAENLLKQMLGENEYGIAGDWVVSWKTVTREMFDSNALKAERPTLFKKYANKISHRRFSIKTAG
jgi:putative phage-type endonuclease